MSASDTQRRSPYQGLIPYEEADAPFFFGREKETRLIIANLFASPLTLLYGASGVGKSSALRAGVAHQLRGRDELLVVVFNAWQSNPVADLKSKITEKAGSLDPRFVPPTDSANLADYLANCAEELDRRLMIILDQFEEYFLYHPKDDEFATEFSRAVTQSGSPVSFLISIREDFYAKLDRFEGRIPTLYDNYLRIEHLDRRAARVAIESPIAEYNRHYTSNGKFSIEPDLVDAVLRQVETGRVVIGEAGRGVVETAESAAGAARIETPFLQLVMTRLWEKEQSDGSSQLRLNTLKDLGGAENIVRTHLDAVISKLSDREQEIAASIFHYLVTPSGTKIAYTASDLASSAELEEAEVVGLLKRLSFGDVRILRTVEPSPDRPTSPRYEIFHDVLAPAILTWRTAYVQAQERAEAERRAEEQRAEAEQRAAIEKQRADEQARVASRFRRLAIALAVVIVLALGAVVLAVAQTVRAKANEARADNYARQSEKLRVEGERLREEGARLQASGEASEHAAMIAQARAEDQRRKTEEQIKIAEQRKVEAEQAQGVARAKTLAAAEANIAAGKATEAAAEQASATRVAFSNLLSVQSKTLLSDRPQLSMLLAIEALRATKSGDPPTPAAEESLRQSLAQIGGRVLKDFHWEQAKYSGVVDLALSPDGRWLASVGASKIHLVDLTAPDAKARTRVLEGSAPITFSADGHWLATTGVKLVTRPDGLSMSVPDGIRLWHVISEADTKPIVLGREHQVSSAEISPDSRWLATFSANDKTVRLWDLKSPELATGKLVAKTLALEAKTDFMTLTISPDSHWLLTVTRRIAFDTGVAQLWDLTSADQVRSFNLSSSNHPVSKAAFSSDGGWLVTGGECDDGARLWNLKAADPAAKPVVLGSSGAIGAVAFSSDNHWLVTGSAEGSGCKSDLTARVWDLTVSEISAQKPYVLSGHEGPVVFATFSPTKNVLITVAGVSSQSSPARGATAHAWQWADVVRSKTSQFRPQVILRDEENPANSFSVSPDGRWLAAKSRNNVLVWDITAPEERPHILRGHEDSLRAIRFSADSRLLVTGSADKTARVWDLSSGSFGTTPLILTSELSLQRQIFQSADRSLLVVTTDEQRNENDSKEEAFFRSGSLAVVYDLTARDPAAQPRLLRGHKMTINDADISSDNRWLVTADYAETRLWDLTAPDPAAQPMVFRGGASQVAISVDKHWLATTSIDGMTYLWNLTAANPTAHPVSTFKSPESDSNHGVHFSSDSRWLWLVTSGPNSGASARLWDLKAPDPAVSATSLSLGMRKVTDFAFSPDGRWLIGFGAYIEQSDTFKDGALLWDLSKRPLDAPFVLPDKPVVDVAFSSDDRWLYTSSYEKGILRWNLNARDPAVMPFVLSPSEAGTDNIFLSPDNRWLVVASGQTYDLWDMIPRDADVPRRVLENLSAPRFSAVAFDPQSRWLVTSSDESTQRWDLTVADPAAAPVALPRTRLNVKGVSADGRWLITSGVQGVELWNMRLEELIDLACRAAGRSLSEQEWKTYFPGQPYRRTCSDLPARE